MSATVDAEKFSKYLNGAPVMNVPGRTFPVRTHYLEDAIEVTGFKAEEDSRNPRNRNDWADDNDAEVDTDKEVVLSTALTGYSKETKSALSRINPHQIQYELIMQLLEKVALSPEYINYSKAILIFLPGMGEIRRLNDLLSAHPVFGSNKRDGGWLVYPLHSTIASEDQEAAFLVPPLGMRKIVIATNIAETGITIPDVTCVIDSGKHKEMRFDERRQLSRLVETFVSRANAKQRRGRAGRVQEGLCFHMFTKDRHDKWVNSIQSANSEYLITKLLIDGRATIP
jgi:ATP-dependent RNA helicase DHX29